ncbi:DNA-directed RNA polymerase III subunit RPC8 [Echinococcus granulosus]|uniref:DNA directed RNA polymerase III subunit n=1 Tax=Echinococcus granulosus TaxID=6210 RepID=U6JB50_ECHGR|nr:DNA-directed RNA polymerase III subunit RPC8 [Echinococcus granulosus]EUB60711.1 DNA-directed RNA polymerase III subunit RPC8 [Echinococcus granulosus]KAH9281834.1 DNA-directed RNA polymerase III subunit RPC8 [Echinococcus granulosus]CDS18932.1 DNA directed RNA polymerase III subunit [Echinococcus granulosus]
MFVVVPITDVVIIKPKKFGSDIEEVIAHELNSRFSNKVLYKVGLCISLWDIKKIGDMYILHDSGSYQVVVSFRLICFRPSIDEVIIGTVKNCTPDGLHISLYFFDDIFIPADKLRHPSKFDFEQQCWIWQYEDDGESADLRIEKNDTIRFRVEQEVWQDPNPNGEKQDQNQPVSPFGNKSPYVILGSIVSDGLGLTCWWIN